MQLLSIIVGSLMLYAAVGLSLACFAWWYDHKRPEESRSGMPEYLLLAFVWVIVLPMMGWMWAREEGIPWARVFCAKCFMAVIGDDEAPKRILVGTGRLGRLLLRSGEVCLIRPDKPKDLPPVGARGQLRCKVKTARYAMVRGRWIDLGQATVVQLLHSSPVALRLDDGASSSYWVDEQIEDVQLYFEPLAAA